MNKNWTEKEYIISTLLSISHWLFLILIGIIAIIKSCISSNIESIDNSINKSQEVVTHLSVVDSTNNGFRVVFATVNAVTQDRLKEIKSRKNINNEFENIKKTAPLYFGDMLHTDIYDFVDFTKKFKIDKDIMIHNIFVCGMKKSNLYIGPNPKITNPATSINFNTEQGILYINSNDIFRFINGEIKIYRYWKCLGINAFSYTDEHFSHFSEDERIR